MVTFADDVTTGDLVAGVAAMLETADETTHRTVRRYLDEMGDEDADPYDRDRAKRGLVQALFPDVAKVELWADQ